ncbi:hypothetical protein SXIM_27890 [Streptomyces xiamenensis]|uniref:Uncharacterized protein n=1 Tax=Streptomyces xiamenensis TaxID=408015 RepID=A0A0F7FVC2_9ACTN|nr:hypothetical protein SXIM_27890 [Streptomyces xiamenensis]
MCRVCRGRLEEDGALDPYAAHPTAGGLLFLGGVACAAGLAGLIGLVVGLAAPPG